MADVNVYFFWPGLIVSILLSIIFSILLTIGLNLQAKRRMNSAGFETYPNDSDYNCNDNCNDDSTNCHDDYMNCHNDYEGDSDFNEKRNNPNFDDEPRSKTSGMIMIGPIPIIFGNGGFRFDKNAFKYALAFFLIVLISWILLSRIVRL
ncbi:TIGR00304 family membrane protein [Methanimicrococcus blatticola]|uniref:Uncharacterized protein DUF131 n=1 Tax=Methanimicrococcus blatticola TaxID=91560 RepID=A0A484F7T6_9EURY|nr:DUF131 domain-containing protein [Methanimicrococcus blatticola]MBZ3934917.1 DUF131 domain-containing protein [Methanimicrococcus blatticola]MCC2508984.1 DUF131 domain-containing protein [Methanimicrococcus blatticola]TDQ70986.1 uncharacterized protein DUF131 [Methanimicrococcus blatticola]